MSIFYRLGVSGNPAFLCSGCLDCLLYFVLTPNTPILACRIDIFDCKITKNTVLPKTYMSFSPI